jgi:hypothetical protein
MARGDADRVSRVVVHACGGLRNTRRFVLETKEDESRDVFLDSFENFQRAEISDVVALVWFREPLRNRRVASRRPTKTLKKRKW